MSKFLDPTVDPFWPGPRRPWLCRFFKHKERKVVYDVAPRGAACTSYCRRCGKTLRQGMWDDKAGRFAIHGKEAGE